MSVVNVESELRTTLTKFETALTTPIISGELESWVTELQKTWQALSAQIQAAVCQLHPRQYEQIAEVDPELLSRIEQLQAEDKKLEKEQESVGQMINAAAEFVPNLEPDEAKAQKFVEKLIDNGLALVIRVRKQEVAVETWFVEAFNRDRGPVD